MGLELDFAGQKVVFAEIVLPLALPKILTYQIPANQPIEPGMRIVVPLRGKRLYTGIIWKIQDQKPGSYELRHALEVLDSEPFLSAIQMKFLSWMAEYYCCSLGEVMIAAIPAPHRLSSESYIQLHPEFDWRADSLESEALWLFSTLQQKEKLALAEVAKAFSAGAGWLRKIRQWQQEGKLLVFDEMPDRYKPRTDLFLGIAEAFQSDEALELLFENLAEKPEEEAFVLKFLSKTRFSQGGNPSWSLKKEFLDISDIEKKILPRLIRKKILVQWREKTNPFKGLVQSELEVPDLSSSQISALAEIEEGWAESKPVLLHGVTGSGKTEVYINLISKTLATGKQCLLLLPEIAITIQIVARLRKVFGDEMGIYHSKASMPDRLEVWEGVETGKLKFVIGVRSSIFLPFRELGLVIIDEEHDGSYKQADPAPRYQGRDTAIFLASLHGAKVLLGSATPSVESYYKAKEGRWKYVALTERFGGVQLPEIQYIDMKLAERTLSVKLDFSNQLLDQLEITHQAEKQSILFQNRRGYAPYLQCKDCGWIAYCPNCDVSLTYHQAKKSLNCHYCGYHVDVIKHCIACGSVNIQTSGFGTEKLEESISQLMPNARIGRMDQDSTQSRKSFERLLFSVQNHQIDILVGTQMVTKGLDFEDVVTVGVFDLDRVLHYPEFRANERTFQLLSQISGRAGRRKERGKVLVQTNLPYHPVYKLVAEQDHLTFYQTEIEHRRTFSYPPFSRLIRLTARHKEKETAEQAIAFLANLLRKKISPNLILGPEPGTIARLRDLFVFNLMIKMPQIVSPSKVKFILLVELQFVKAEKPYKSVDWIVDVDPN